MLRRSLRSFGLAGIIVALTACTHPTARLHLIETIERGRHCTVVAYGTSLTASGAWVAQLTRALEIRYPGSLTVINSGQGAMASPWGVENLQNRVLDKNPDLVLIEFAINDAYVPFGISPQASRDNLSVMVRQIRAARPNAEIAVMTTNPAAGIYRDQRPHLEAYYEGYRAIASTMALLLVDQEPKWQELINRNPSQFREFVPDGLHPNDIGCEQIVTPLLLQMLDVDDRAAHGRSRVSP